MIQIELAKTNNWLKENGYSLMKEEQIYDEQLKDVITNTRWYLDNIEFMIEYRVSWKDYRRKSATIPLRHVKLTKHL